MQTKMEFNEDEFKDPRHWQDINPDRRYLAKEVAAILRCSESMVYKLRYLGELKWVSVGSVHRFPGWTIIDYIKENCSED